MAWESIHINVAAIRERIRWIEGQNVINNADRNELMALIALLHEYELSVKMTIERLGDYTASIIVGNDNLIHLTQDKLNEVKPVIEVKVSNDNVPDRREQLVLSIDEGIKIPKNTTMVFNLKNLQNTNRSVNTGEIENKGIKTVVDISDADFKKILFHLDKDSNKFIFYDSDMKVIASTGKVKMSGQNEVVQASGLTKELEGKLKEMFLDPPPEFKENLKQMYQELNKDGSFQSPVSNAKGRGR